MKTNKAFWVVTLATLLLVALTASLGNWQLNRAATKQALAADIARQNSLEPVGNPALAEAAMGTLRDEAPWMHRRAELRGQWLGDRTVFLDNRQMDGLVGFFVVTPFQLQPQGVVLLVQRGWVQRDFTERKRLPSVATPAGVVQLAGRLTGWPGKLYEPTSLSQDASPPHGLIRQNIERAEIAGQTGLPVLPLSLLQTDAAQDGLRRRWPAPNTGVDKHYAYAAQWFALSALAAGLYLWFQWIAPYVRFRSLSDSA